MLTASNWKRLILCGLSLLCFAWLQVAQAEKKHWVNGYYRKNGTYVAGYYRGGGGMSSKSRSAGKSSAASTASKLTLLKQMPQTPAAPPKAPLVFPPLEPAREPSWVRQQRLEKSLGMGTPSPKPTSATIKVPIPKPISFPFRGRCIEVIDGNKLRVAGNSSTLTVWLAGVYAPDLKQSFGSQAKAALSTLVLGKTVTLYDTPVRQQAMRCVWVFEGATCINRELVKGGMAWWNRVQFPLETKLQEAQQTAQDSKLGLWGEANPIAPWDWNPLYKG